ncbi:hypothetical protein GWK47_049318 [Chionoecetes opilio]|uniref:Uncharacterized protein n=1 Tax=Chionoecetes opilio TaxID=41210 RepID=A0A8J4Y2B8_CHIOP|nr:hypothetical protein GWK47_049318 [Chionoecetes opilio]
MVHTRLEPSDHDVDFEGFDHEGFLQGFLSGERGDSDDVAGTSGADTSANVPTGSPTEDVLPGPSAEAPTATTETDEADVRESHSDEEAAADGVEITRVPKKGRKREAKSAQWVVCTAKKRRNLGQAYQSYKTKTMMQAKTLGPPVTTAASLSWVKRLPHKSSNRSGT